MDVLDSLCQRMKLYQARAGPDFPYIKGAKSQLREVMDDLTQRSKVKLNYELPDEVVEDYTYEMGRLKFKVNTRYYMRFWETQVQGLLIQDIV